MHTKEEEIEPIAKEDTASPEVTQTLELLGK